MKKIFILCFVLLGTHLSANSSSPFDEYIKTRGYKTSKSGLKGSNYSEAWISKDDGAWIRLYIFKDKANKKIVQVRQECTICKSSKISTNDFLSACKFEQENLHSFLKGKSISENILKELYFFDKMDRTLKTEKKNFGSVRVTRTVAYCDARDGYYLSMDYFLKKILQN